MMETVKQSSEVVVQQLIPWSSSGSSISLPALQMAAETVVRSFYGY